MNSRRDLQSKPSGHGDVLTAISDGLISLLKEFYGRGPTRAKSYYEDDPVVCVLRGGFSRVEETLLDGGRGHAVIQQRMEFQELMRDRFAEVIEDATGKRVIGFMSGNQQQPDLMCEVFVLAPTDLLEEHEISVHGPPPPCPSRATRSRQDRRGWQSPRSLDRMKGSLWIYCCFSSLFDRSQRGWWGFCKPPRGSSPS